jgi:hypothetical protein
VAVSYLNMPDLSPLEDDLELLDKVVVEEAIECRVAAGRGHSNHVAENKDQHHVFW